MNPGTLARLVLAARRRRATSPAETIISTGMGGEREDHARRFLERLAALDADGAVAMLSLDWMGTAVSERSAKEEKRVYRGEDGLREWVEWIRARRGRTVVERLRFRDYGDALLVVGENRSVGQRTPFGSAEQRRVFVTVFRFDRDQIASVNAYARYEEALAAEGLADEEPR